MSQSASVKAYEHISEGILSGVYSEGEFLDETRLAGDIGCSRTPIREALHKLRAEWFIDVIPRRGAQVRVTTLSEMEAVYEARLVLETHAFDSICRQSLPLPSEAEDLLGEMASIPRGTDLTRYVKLDQMFHSSLVKRAGNTVIFDLYQTLRPRHIKVGSRVINISPARRTTVEEEHRAILASLREQDCEGAVETLREHLRYVPEVVSSLPS